MSRRRQHHSSGAKDSSIPISISNDNENGDESKLKSPRHGMFMSSSPFFAKLFSPTRPKQQHKQTQQKQQQHHAPSSPRTKRYNVQQLPIYGNHISSSAALSGGIPPPSLLCGAGQAFFVGNLKQTKRKRRRGGSIWNRLASTPLYVFCIVIFSCYVVLFPLTNILLEYGRELSPYYAHNIKNRRYPRIEDYPGLESVGSIDDAKQFARIFDIEYDKFMFGSSTNNGEGNNQQQQKQVSKQWSERLSILEEIIPDWFHRYVPKQSWSIRAENEDREEEDNGDGDGDDASNNGDEEEDNNEEDGEEEGSHNDNEHLVDEEENEEKEILPSQRKLLTLKNFDKIPPHSNCPSDLSPKDISTTLITQLSTERIFLLKETCSRWKDPIVAVVYISTSSSQDDIEQRINDLKDNCPQLRVITYNASDEEDETYYPVNRLRNIGLDVAKTSHILMADVDFIPSQNLHETIHKELTNKEGDLVIDERTAIIVPAFERHPPKPCETLEDCSSYIRTDNSFIPRTYDELRNCMSNDNCLVFQQKENWEGHYSTNSESWLKGKWYEEGTSSLETAKKKLLKRIKCFHSARYEPYVVIRWCPSTSSSESENGRQLITPLSPYYDERFHGYGKNKIQLISHLRFMGYKFAVLPKGFIVHNPHPESSTKKIWNNVKNYDLHHDMDDLYPKFLDELWTKYKDHRKEIVKPCEEKSKR